MSDLGPLPGLESPPLPVYLPPPYCFEIKWQRRVEQETGGSGKGPSPGFHTAPHSMSDYRATQPEEEHIREQLRAR